MNLFTLVATLGLDTSDFSKNIGSAVDQGKKAGSGIAKGFAVVGKAAAAFAIAAGAAYVGVVKTAADKVAELEQNVGAAIAVWGEGLGEQQRRIAMQAAENVGLSTSQYLAMSNKMGSLMQGMGFDTREAFALSTQAIQRTADVASIMNIPIENAMEAINGLAKGNFTMMDNLGVAMDETALANYALEQGIKKSTSKMSTQEKVALALQMYMDKTAYATGNFAKEAEGLAGATTILKASWSNLLDGSGTPEDFGNQLVNYINTYMDVLGEVAPRILKSMGTVFTTLKDRFTGWLDSVGGIGGAIRTAVNWTLGAFDAPSLEEIEGQVSDWWNGLEGDSVYERLKSALNWTMGEFVEPAVDQWALQVSVWWNTTALPAAKSAMKWTWGELILPAWETEIETPVRAWWGNMSDEFADVFEYEWSVDGFQFPTWSQLEAKARGFWNEVEEALSSIFTLDIGLNFRFLGFNNAAGGQIAQYANENADWLSTVNTSQYGVSPGLNGAGFGTIVNNTNINLSSVAQNPADVAFAVDQAASHARFYD